MKNIIVTGSSRGIGLEIVKLLSENGHQVLAISRKIASEINQLPGVTCLSVDLTNHQDLELVKQFITTNWQQVDAVIHNAGQLILKPFLEISVSEFQSVYNTNIFAVIALNQMVIPFMKSGSHVVSISSMGGIQGSVKFPGLSAYSSSKGALITLSELLSEEFKEKGISFNVLALGAVQTEMLEEAFPGYSAPISSNEMAKYITDFTLSGNKYFNGKVLQVSSTTP